MIKHTITIISGPTGSGKSTILSLLQRRSPQLDPCRARSQEDLDRQLASLSKPETVFVCEGFDPVPGDILSRLVLNGYQVFTIALGRTPAV